MEINDCRYISENRIEHNEYEWFLDIHTNALIRHNMGTDDYEAMALLPSITGRHDYGSVLESNNHIVIVPYSEAKIPVFNIVDESMEYINLEGKQMDGRAFWGAVSRGKYVYLVPCAFEYFVIYDVLTKKIKYIPIGDGGYGAWGNVCYDDSDLFFTKLDSGELVRMSFETEIINKYPIDDFKGGGVAFISDNVLVVPFCANRLLLCAKNGKIVKQITTFPKGYLPGEYGSFSRIVDVGMKIVFLPRAANMALILDKRTLEIHEFAIRQDMRDRHYLKDNDRILYFEQYEPFIDFVYDLECCYLIRTYDGVLIDKEGAEWNTPLKKCDISRIHNSTYFRVNKEGASLLNNVDNFLRYLIE